MAGEVRPQTDAWEELVARVATSRRNRVVSGAAASALLIMAVLLLVPYLTGLGPLSASRTVVSFREKFNLSNCPAPSIDCHRPFVYNVAMGFGSAWINEGRDLVRIDLGTNQVKHLDAQSMGLDLADFSTAIEDVAIGDDGVWVWHTTASRDLAVSRLDPLTNRRVATISLPKIRMRGHGDRSVLVGEGFVWGIVDGNQLPPPTSVAEIYKIDPRTDRITGSLGANSLSFAVGEGAFWYVDQVRGLIRVDPQSLAGEPVPRTPLEVNGIAAGEGAVWLTTGDYTLNTGGKLIRVDPKTDRVKEVASLTRAAGPVVVGNGAVWFMDYSNGSELVWLDPSSSRVMGRVSVPVRGPVDIAVGDRTVWVTSMNDAVAYRFDISRR